MPQFLFVTGVARSGTTALTQILASHDQIALGMERFKALNRPDRVAELTPEKFTEEAFFDFTDGLTNIVPTNPRWRAYYRAQRRKFAHCAYVGDKVPGNHRYLQNLRKQLPGAKFVAIIRDIFQVAASWEARARNKADRGWNRQVGAKKSVGAWNEGLELVKREVDSGNPDLLVVEHNRFFGDPGMAQLDRVLDFLGLTADATSAAAMASAHAHFAEAVASKRRALPAEVRAFIRAEAKFDIWEDLAQVAGARLNEDVGEERELPIRESSALSGPASTSVSK